MTKEEFITKRTKIMSKMLDNSDEYGIYPTTTAYAELDDLFDSICIEGGEQPWEPSRAQQLRNQKLK